MIILAMAGQVNLLAQSEFSSPTISIGVVVSDLEKSVDFYNSVIGMKKVGVFE